MARCLPLAYPAGMGWRSSVSVAVVAIAMAGCTEAQLEDEWELTASQLADLPLAVVDSFPADGVDGIGHRIQPYVLFTRPLTADEEGALGAGQILRLDNGATVSALVDLDSDGMGLYLRPDDLRRDRDYRLDFTPPGEARDVPLSHVFSTDHPAGAAFNMSTGLKVDQFGRSAAQAQSLTDTFVPGVYPLWVMQIAGLPAQIDAPTRVDIVFAPARIDDDPGPAHFLKREYGYVGRFVDVTVSEDGSFSHAQEGVFLPLWSADDVLLMYLEDVTLSGRVIPGDPARVSEMTLTGVIGTRWLLSLASQGGPWRNAIRSLRPDIDTNGNGIEDAATFTLSSSPQPIELDDIDP